jgi:UDPglucose--hexose-1-phosphate uridylyltransferase
VRRHRFDPLTGDGVILCDERRPEAAPPLPPPGAVPCAHCPEHAVGRTLAALPSEGPWSARAVPHRVPAVRVEEPGETHAQGPFLEGDGLGAHEVLVESPEHRPLHHQDPGRAVTAALLLRERLRDLRQDRRLATFTWWREDHGAASHPTSQLVALPYVPDLVARATSQQVAWAGRHGRSLLAELVAADLADGRRLVWAGEHAVAVCPWAPRSAFEVWIVPRRAGGFPGDAPPEVWEEVAGAAIRLRRAQEEALGPAPAVTTLRSGPVDAPPAVGWFVSVRPRLTPPSGLDEATGTVMVGVFPEESAAVLRGALRER